MNQTISAYIFQIRAERLRRLALPRGVCEAAYKTSVPFPDFRSFFPSYRSSERHRLIFSDVLSVRSSQELLFRRGKADISFQPFRQQEKLTFTEKAIIPASKAMLHFPFFNTLHSHSSGRTPIAVNLRPISENPAFSARRHDGMFSAHVLYDTDFPSEISNSQRAESAQRAYLRLL